MEMCYVWCGVSAVLQMSSISSNANQQKQQNRKQRRAHLQPNAQDTKESAPSVFSPVVHPQPQPPTETASSVEKIDTLAHIASLLGYMWSACTAVMSKKEWNSWSINIDQVCSRLVTFLCDFSHWHGLESLGLDVAKYPAPLYVWVKLCASYTNTFEDPEMKGGLDYTIPCQRTLMDLFRWLSARSTHGLSTIQAHADLLLFAANTSGVAFDYIYQDLNEEHVLDYDYIDPKDGISTALSIQLALPYAYAAIDSRCEILVRQMSRNALLKARVGSASKEGCPPSLMGCDMLTLALRHTQPRPLSARALMERVPELLEHLPVHMSAEFANPPCRAPENKEKEPSAEAKCERLAVLFEAKARRDAIYRPKFARAMLMSLSMKTTVCRNDTFTMIDILNHDNCVVPAVPVILPALVNVVCQYLGDGL